MNEIKKQKLSEEECEQVVGGGGSGPYSQSLSNLEDNSAIDDGDGEDGIDKSSPLLIKN